MKTILIVCLLLGLVLNQSTLILNSAQIKGMTGTSLAGSLSGGTKITIKGTGFTSDFAKISVYVGFYPCKLQDGSTQTSIACFTSPTTSTSDLNGLPIKVYQNDILYILEGYTFSYTNEYTPLVNDVFHSTSLAGEDIYFYGKHKIVHSSEDPRDVQDVIGFYIGDELCDIMEIAQDITPNSWNSFICKSAIYQQGGRYNLTEHVTPGYARFAQKINRASIVHEDPWQHVVLPTVKSVTPNSGFPDGQDITITGSGFSEDKAVVSVEVDGVNCPIKSSTISEITCTLDPRSSAASKQLPTNSSSPQGNSFLGGSGFKYYKYQTNGLGSTNFRNFKTAVESSSSSITLLEEGVVGQLETTKADPYTGEIFKGYFYAPVSGSYIFRGAVDDNFGLYINPDYGISEIPTDPYIYQDSYSKSGRDNYYIENYTTALGTPLTFQAGKYYYLQLYTINNAGSGFVKISVEVPNSDDTLPFQRYEVNQIETAFTNDPEIRTFTLEVGAGTSGTFKLRITRYLPGALLPDYDKTVTLNYNASASDFTNALNQFNSYNGYWFSVALEVFDDQGATTTGDVGVKFVWTVSIYKLREANFVSQNFKFDLAGITTTGTPTFTQTLVQEHCPLISGTFTMEIDGRSVNVYDSTTKTYSNPNIPYNVADSTLRSAIRQLPGFGTTDVTRSGICEYGCTFLIYYDLPLDVPDIVLSGASLTGGQTGTFPEVTFFQTLKYSPNIIFRPVDERFMFIAESSPQVQVTVNNVLGTCTGACDYTFIDVVPTVTAQTLSTAQLSITINDVNTANYPVGDISIKFGNQVCSNIAGTFASLTCDLPTNSDNSPTIQAGSYSVEVFVNQLGKVKIDANVNDIVFGFSTTSTSPASVSENGGNTFGIIGTGFPLNAEDAVIQMCGQTVSVVSTTNIQTNIIAPQCPQGTQTITYTFGSFSDTVDITVSAATTSMQITSISPQTASPAEKGVMDINGNNFPTDISTIKATLVGTKTYSMRVLSSTGTLIKCGIPGGVAGSYKVVITASGENAVANPSTATDFQYKIPLTSISPLTGSHFGGTLITISGSNFSPATTDMMVTIGHQLNSICRIQSLSQTSITCRTPSTHADWTSPTQEIIATSKLIADSVCETSCDFTYKTQANSIALSALSSTSVASGATLTLTGSRFDLTSSLADLRVVFTHTLTNVQTVVTPTSPSATSLTVVVPSIQGGDYSVRVRLDPEGESNGLSVTLQTNFNPTSYQSSVHGGSVILSGQGLPSNWPANFWSLQLVSNGQKLDVDVISTGASQLALKLPAGIDGNIITVTLTNPFDDKNTATITQSSSQTPALTLTTSSPISAGASQLTLSIDTVTTLNPTKLYINNVLNPHNLQQIGFTRSANTLTSDSFTFGSGKYVVSVLYEGKGWATVNSGEFVVSASGAYSATAVSSSYAGGQLVVSSSELSSDSIIKIGGFTGKVIDQSNGETTFEIPPLITSQVLGWYSVLKKVEIVKPAVIISDGGNNPANAFDSKHQTFYSSANAECYIGLDAGQNVLVNPQGIKFFPNSMWAVVAQYLKGAIIEASVDGSTYTEISTVGPDVHNGWNSLHPSTASNYRFFRIRHDATSECKIAEFEVSGIIYNNIAVTTDSTAVDVILNNGAITQTLSGIVTYEKTSTPVISSIDQTTGSVKGGYDITLSGQNLGNLDVVIDGIPCAIQSSTATTATCTVGATNGFPSQNSFKVSLDGNKAVIQQEFIYVMRWSDPDTWGTDKPPQEGDLVYVPTGMILYVDQTTPRLQGIIVEGGKLIFADEGDIQVHAGMILVMRGQFRAGTVDTPYLNKLTFVMYGGYHEKQLPMFGNKFIGCFECKFSMWGKERPVTWTMLETTANAGTSVLEVQNSSIDWQVGEKLVVASTSFDHNEAEQVTIASISGTTITIQETLQFKHFAGEETYGAKTLTMRAQVGLLSRNIKMMGDETSEAGQYGSHLMMAGRAENGMVSHVGYTEFTHCGQPRIVGRYCIHFHMNGDVTDSLVTGNAVHHSFARILTLHAIHFLRVKDNVGYRVKGHNFFIEDGIETHNIIDHNLVVSSLMTFNMMQTDISVASFWVTNPLNDLINNHGAGGDFYAFWYQIKPHPDGPSSTSDICPTGNPLGASHDNVAHSYVRFGLRIFKYAAREIPCGDIRNDALEDPWSENPSIQSRFYNYMTYKIGEAGLLAEETGNMIFENFVIAESGHSGIQFYRTNLTRELVIAKDMAIIGITNTNPPSDLTIFNGVRGAIGPRTSGWKMQDIHFYNFNSQMTILQTCSKCDNILLYTNRAIEYFITNIAFTNVSGKYLFQNGLKRSIIYVSDSSLSTEFDSDSASRASSTIVPYYQHLADETACVNASTTTDWDDALMCDDTVKIRGITITNAIPHNTFKNIAIKVKKINSLTDPVVDQNTTLFSQFKSLKGSMQPKDKPFAWAMPYVAGSIYDIWWLDLVDFEHIAIELSQMYQDADPAVLFRFKYLQQRQLFEIGDLIQRKIVGDYRTISADLLDASTCTLGQYNNDADNRLLNLCVSSKNKATDFQYLDVNGIKCRYLCPSPTGEFIKENFVRVWSNATQWPNGVLPSAGDNVSIHGNWTIMMDIQPEPMEFFYVDGDVIIPQTNLDVHIKAQSIWIRAGSIKAGNASVPHPGQVKFQITGNKLDNGYVMTPDIAGTKLFVVHGALQLYGKAPSTKWTKMKASAAAGDTSITVLANSGWEIGDQIVIAPSYTSASQYEKVTITAISGSVVTFTPALQFGHYGATSATINNDYGTLDARTGVGHLTRSIKIFAGPDSQWGFRIIVNSFLDGQVERYGKMVLSGVQLNEGGQYDTEHSAIHLMRVSSATKILGSSIQNCKAYCLDVSLSSTVNVQNNVFYKGRINHARVLQVNNFVFKNNLMIAAIKRPTVVAEDLIACYASWQKVDETVTVKDNLCQGSDLHGFALGFSSCDDTFDPYVGNTVGSAKVGFIFEKVSGTCMRVRGLRAYACSIGQISSPPGTESILFQNFIMADNQRAVSLRFGKEGDDRTAYFKDSYITAISRPSCTECYGSTATDCSNNYGVRMLAVTVNGESMPKKFGTGFDVICKQETYDSKAFLNNVTFDNFRLSYTNLPQCSSNIVFKSHPTASDITGSHNLRDCLCNNCELPALAWFEPPKAKDLGWSGGCGSILCTGKNNYLIHDYTGGFLGEPSILMSNNSEIGDNSENCTFISVMNGHHCVREDFGVMEYESIAPDFNTRIMWPVYLKYEGGTWNTSTNGWREWAWEGSQPLNLRLGRFVSIVQLYKTYNMTFESQPPIDMRLQFQRRSQQGDNSEFVVIKLHYPRPNSIRIQNRGVTIKPITLRDATVNQQDLDTTVCGSNKFFYENYTVHFVLTGDKACQVRVSLTNSIQLTARFEMSIDDFFANDGETKFINRICAALNITDYSRVKIVGVYNGSVTIKSYIEQPASTVDDAPNQNNTASAQQMIGLKQVLLALEQSGQLATDFSDFGTLLQLDAQVYDHPVPVDPTPNPTDPTDPEQPEEFYEDQPPVAEEASKIGLIVGVVVGVVSVFAVTFGIVVYMIRKRARISQIAEMEMDSQVGKIQNIQNPSSVYNFAEKK